MPNLRASSQLAYLLRIAILLVGENSLNLEKPIHVKGHYSNTTKLRHLCLHIVIRKASEHLQKVLIISRSNCFLWRHLCLHIVAGTGSCLGENYTSPCEQATYDPVGMWNTSMFHCLYLGSLQFPSNRHLKDGRRMGKLLTTHVDWNQNSPHLVQVSLRVTCTTTPTYYENWLKNLDYSTQKIWAIMTQGFSSSLNCVEPLLWCELWPIWWSPSKSNNMLHTQSINLSCLAFSRQNCRNSYVFVGSIVGRMANCKGVWITLDSHNLDRNGFIFGSTLSHAGSLF